MAIVFCAIMMFVGNGSNVLPQVIRSWLYAGSGPDTLLVNALLLNIALVIFGWRRYRELEEEMARTRQAEEKARLMAETDPLTQCLNRRSLTTTTNDFVAMNAKAGRATAFVMIDLDDFKRINDFNGHKVGDGVLKAIAERISNRLPEESLLARLGGDEFAFVIGFDPAQRTRVDALVGRVITSVCLPIEVDEIVVETTISVGIAWSDPAPTDGKDLIEAETLMHRADIAMYRAKKNGKNRYYWFERSMENDLHFRNELESGIRTGLREGHFVPYFEQQIDLVSGELVGFEMLARWISPEHGVLGPDLFIPIAEEIGVIGELSEQLIGRALDEANTWDPNLTLSVNISPVQMRDPWFSQKLIKLLLNHKFPARRLDVEITESCLHENIGMVHSMVTSLKNQGVSISLDDFGTGYSSLAQLRNLPFDRLKVDRSFVSELQEEGGNGQIMNAIVSLAAGLDLPITAEGIESEDVLSQLQAMGPLKGQGYLYGEPEDAAAVRRRLAAKSLLSDGSSNNRTDQAHSLPEAAKPDTAKQSLAG
ncbi:putative membrane protein [Alteripontixanthobacter maritimus]|uniref:Putative membrane protein n=1 Tax=Alteripontixanthobacter maritimus TaxID=2161824 RepID=A0A369QAR6_9SPHN|nr:EAL domain-containing protein [Alteripontixanthobacter maritimus]RDC60316.1 putative membrane protein [Alteripontixanthobacter maritimus]